MLADRYVIREEYPSGHEMSEKEYGPASVADFRSGTVPKWTNMLEFMDHHASEFWTREQMLDELFNSGVLYLPEGETLRAEPILDHVVVIAWSEPEDGVSVFGPYGSLEEAKANVPVIKRFCGIIPEDVEFLFTQLIK